MSRRNLLVVAVVLSLASAIPTDGADAQVPPGFSNRPTFTADGLANVVFMGGTVDHLEMAAAIAGANGVWVQDPTGGFQVLVVRGPAFLKDAFKARLPGSLGPSAVMLTSGPPAKTLRALADRTGFLIGNVIRFVADKTNDSSNLTLAQEFNYVTTFPNMRNVMTATWHVQPCHSCQSRRGSRFRQNARSQGDGHSADLGKAEREPRAAWREQDPPIRPPG